MYKQKEKKMTDQNMDSVNEYGVSRKQETIDTLWVKYRKTLEMLNDALDKNETLTEELDDALGRNETLTEEFEDALLENRNLKADLDQHKVELDKKPKEVEVIKEVEVEKEVEKIVEVEAKIDLSVPTDVAELEKRLEDRLNK